nr:unnamed protein product [Digitaria exilis]
MRPLLGSPIRTTLRSADKGTAAAAGFVETAVAEAAAARGARVRALAARGERSRRLGGGEGDWAAPPASPTFLLGLAQKAPAAAKRR